MLASAGAQPLPGAEDKEDELVASEGSSCSSESKKEGTYCGGDVGGSTAVVAAIGTTGAGAASRGGNG